MILELMGVLLFAMMMFSMESVFKKEVDYEVLIQQKNESTDNWLKTLEKCNQPFFLEPRLFQDMRNIIEEAFKYDYNSMIEEFDFYLRMTPRD